MAWQDERSVVNGRSLALLGSLLVAACQGVVQDRDSGSAGRAATSGPSGTSGMSTGTAGSTGGQSGGMPGGPWSPAVGTSWQWQLMGTIDESVSAQMFDVDLFGTTPETVASLQAAGHRVVCYVNAGVFESWRPDAASFPAAVKGKADPGWQGEQWLDIRQWSVLQPILEARMDLCRSKGFDGIELDNVDGYSNSSGFPLTAADQLTYNRALAASAHARGLSVGLKNDLGQVPDLVGSFDWALNEQCFEFGECDALRPFIAAGKATFNVEYNLATTDFCPHAKAMGLSSMAKHLNLDAYRVPCP
jgi:hypothetical protein